MVSGEPHGQVWRVGFKPDPWVWADWKWAQGGRFNGRWDDSAGMFRTLYVADSLLGCLLEVLASLRPDPAVAAEMSEIVEDEEDANAYPTVGAGEIDPTWLERRAAGSAVLRGRYCAVTETESVAALRTRFLRLALSLGREDFDAAALKDGATRDLTQAISTYLYKTTDHDGVQFNSRHGDDMAMWALFERSSSYSVSPLLQGIEAVELEVSTPSLLEAFRMHGLRWKGAPPDPEPAPLASPILVEVDPREVHARNFGEGGMTPETPLGAALLWQSALEDPAEYEVALARLTLDPDLWHGFTEAPSIMGRLSATTYPVFDPEYPDTIAHIKFIDYAGEGAAQSLTWAELDDVWFVTLLLDPGIGSESAWWRVWGLNHNVTPTAADVLGEA